LNGLRHANRVLGENAFVENDWKVIGEYVYDAEGGRHQAFYSPRRDTTVLGELIRPHERVQVEQSLKYSAAEAEELWKRAGMAEIGQWRHREEYGEWLYFYIAQRGVSQRHVPLFGAVPLGLPKLTPRFPGKRGAVIRYPRVSEHSGMSSLSSLATACPVGWLACQTAGPALHQSLGSCYLSFEEERLH
jgi:hypothetical protein